MEQILGSTVLLTGYGEQTTKYQAAQLNATASAAKTFPGAGNVVGTASGPSPSLTDPFSPHLLQCAPHCQTTHFQDPQYHPQYGECCFNISSFHYGHGEYLPDQPQ